MGWTGPGEIVQERPVLSPGETGKRPQTSVLRNRPKNSGIAGKPESGGVQGWERLTALKKGPY